ncbi:MAG: AzlD domain-containing protein [Comamonas sp.]
MMAAWQAVAALDLYAWLAVVALVLSTVLARGCLLLPRRDPRLPPWLREGLRHAPLATLMAIVAPAVLAPQAPGAGEAARWLALAVCAGCFFGLRRGVTGAMLAGSAVYLGAMLLI